jgi:signal transduction histidine kinase
VQADAAAGASPAANATGGTPLDRAVQGAIFGMLILGRDRRVELVNERACTLMLVPGVVSPVGRSLSAVVEPELRSSIEGIVTAVLRERRMLEADRIPGAGGRVLDLVGYPVDDGSEARHVVVVANDVTERLALESQLLQSSKLATIGELAAGVAHEINNPVAFVQSNLRTLQRYWQRVGEVLTLTEKLFAKIRETGGPELLADLAAVESSATEQNLELVFSDVGAALAESLDGTARIQKIVQDLKSFARPDDARFRPEDINQVLERALRLVGNEAKYVAEVLRDLGEVPAVFGNASQLNQVFVNLLMNAVQAISGRGKIYVRTYREGEKVCVDVEDTGAGIPDHVLPKIFNPFFTTKPPGKGTGLGLSVSYGIVERHGGVIRVHTEIGKGSRFTVVLNTVNPLGEAEEPDGGTEP